jgi:hypothetical protein
MTLSIDMQLTTAKICVPSLLDAGNAHPPAKTFLQATSASAIQKMRRLRGDFL